MGQWLWWVSCYRAHLAYWYLLDVQQLEWRVRFPEKTCGCSTAGDLASAFQVFSLIKLVRGTTAVRSLLLVFEGLSRTHADRTVQGLNG